MISIIDDEIELVADFVYSDFTIQHILFKKLAIT